MNWLSRKRRRQSTTAHSRTPRPISCRFCCARRDRARSRSSRCRFGNGDCRRGRAEHRRPARLGHGGGHLAPNGRTGATPPRRIFKCGVSGRRRSGAYISRRQLRCGALQSRADVFSDPLRGLSEFHRVLRSGGRAAVSVLTAPERSYNGRINVVVARYMPSLAEATARTFALGDPRGCTRSSPRRVSRISKPIPRNIPSCCRPLTRITVRSRGAAHRPGRLYYHCPRTCGVQYARRCGATSAIWAALSRSRWKSGSRAVVADSSRTSLSSGGMVLAC